MKTMQHVKLLFLLSVIGTGLTALAGCAVDPAQLQLSYDTKPSQGGF